MLSAACRLSLMTLLAGCSGVDFPWTEGQAAPAAPAAANATADSGFAAMEPLPASPARQGDRQETGAGRPPAAAVAKAVPTPPRARPAQPPQGDARTLRPATAHPPTEPTPTRAASLPGNLVGLDERAVVRLLGQPESVRSKPPATVWSYTAADCELEVFFYLDLASERFRVLAYEVYARRGSREMKKVCLGRIQSARRTN